ncbi:MAG: hypothetical protein J5639_08635 [Bacteroidales bacterium]|nr:hypothetical protein [Bacteroidales bacterium]
MEYYLISTEHLTDSLWFRDEEDFKIGMNHVAATVWVTGVSVLAFVLMTNHVHFVLACIRSAAEQFISQFKLRYSLYFQKKYGEKEFLRRNKVDIRRVGLERESLERSIAYVIMNPVAANIVLNASGYPWSSAASLFNVNPKRGRKLQEVSVREKRRVLRTALPLNGDWILGDDGYILPNCYVCVSEVETLFRSPSRLQYFLSTSSKARLTLERRADSLPAFRDHVLLSAADDLCRTLFQKESREMLSEVEVSELLRQLKRRLNADVAQLSRALGIQYERATRLLDSV